MRRASLHLALGVAVAIALPAQASKSVPTAATSAPAATAATSTASVDPKAVSALNAMGSYLRGLKQFSVRADTTVDMVMDDGQKLEFPGTVDYKVRAPNGLRVDVKTDRKEREMYFDGKTLTVYAPRMKYYASAQAPATIRELLATADSRYGIELPLADLFLWGTDADQAKALKSAVFVGPARIGGTVTEQYAFRQDGVDWQLWIEAGDKPLPRRLVITTTDDPALPEYAATLTWNTAAQFKDSSFSFTPSRDAQRIKLAEVDVAVVEDKEGTQ